LLITNPGGLVVKQDALKVATLSSDLVKFTLPSPVSMTGNVKCASCSSSVKSTLPSIAESGLTCPSLKSLLSSPFQLPVVIKAASPCASVKSTLPSPVTISGVVPAASTCAPVMPTSSENFKSVSASQLVDNSAAAAELAAGGTATEAAAANESEQVNPIMTATPIQVQIADSALEGNHHGGAETVAAKKPIDHLIEAVRMQDHSFWQQLFLYFKLSYLLFEILSGEGFITSNALRLSQFYLHSQHERSGTTLGN
jgi:hypothetical protein